MKRNKVISILLSVCLPVFTFGAAMADQTLKPDGAPKPTPTSIPTLAPSQDVWPALPPLTPAGYLSPEAGVEEFVHADVEKGLWIYISDGLRVQIQRFTDPNMPLIWYEANIRTKGDEVLRSVPANPKRPAGTMNRPETIARSNQLVFAVNDDQFVQRKTDETVVGVIVRGGKIYNKTTLRSGSNGFPTLETMALFPDGNLRVYQSREHTSQEYIDMGATDVFSFDPILIRDGIVNEKLSGLYVNSMQPRCGFGMVEPYHYVCVVA